ncbi:hypothetical protein ATHENA_53 [Mycobacterium phage Athena]|uniref:Uncharacterized protein n=1 Tax=Mycobacterium phage Athena TaxID=1089113 RepID=G8I776_9CAUD|nr:hypothetical protein FDH90_gp053 [Mycobacterium phage Athena]AER48569.1 hypothetical protein ATHENA_53 [Mycobacterium phage Athena]
MSADLVRLAADRLEADDE